MKSLLIGEMNFLRHLISSISSNEFNDGIFLKID